MRQSVRNRPAGYFGPGDAQRRVASSDTRQMYHQQNVYNQNPPAKKTTSQSRQSKDQQQQMMNRSGFRDATNKMNSSSFLMNASDLLSRGDVEPEDDMAQLQRPGPSSMTRNIQQSNGVRKHSQQPKNRLSLAGEAYQSSLLTRYVKQQAPGMPTSQSIHSALNHERANGWPGLAPVRQPGHQQQAVQPQNNNAQRASGIPKPTQFNKSKNKTGRAPSQGNLIGGTSGNNQRSGAKVKYAFQTPITYQNEQEIMKKIFGASRAVNRTSSDHRMGQPQQQTFKQQMNQTTYSYQEQMNRNVGSSANKRKTPEKYSNKMPPKAQQKRAPGTVYTQKSSMGLAVDPHRESVREQYMLESSPVKQLKQQPLQHRAGKDPRDQHINTLLASSAVQAYSGEENSSFLASNSSPPRRPSNLNSNQQTLTITEYSEPRNNQALQKKNLLHQNARSPTKQSTNKEDMAQDSAERAFFELQDAKVNFFQEKTEHEDKMEQRRINQTFTNGFYKDQTGSGQQTTTASSTTQGPSSMVMANASRSNGFNAGGNPMLKTMGNRFAADKPLIGDDKDLKSDVADLSRDDMKERLFVAEKVMKTLFKRNKELEEMQSNFPDQDGGGTCQDDNSPTLHGQNAMKEKIKELERQLQAMEKNQRDRGSEPQSYKEFMTMRLEQSQAEAKRHFENYVSVRDQLNQQMDKQLQIDAQQNSKSIHATPDTRSNVTPQSIKSNKLRHDLHQRAHEANLQEQELVLKRAAEAYAKGLAQIEQKLINKDTTVAFKDAKIKMLQEEIERRKFMEAKVQTYVRSLIQQNEKCKTFIKEIKNEGGIVENARDFMHKLETSQFDEHDGQSTENEDDEAVEGDDNEVDEEYEEGDANENEDVAISDI